MNCQLFQKDFVMAFVKAVGWEYFKRAKNSKSICRNITKATVHNDGDAKDAPFRLNLL